MRVRRHTSQSKLLEYNLYPADFPQATTTNPPPPTRTHTHFVKMEIYNLFLLLKIARTQNLRSFYEVLPSDIEIKNYCTAPPYCKVTMPDISTTVWYKNVTNGGRSHSHYSLETVYFNHTFTNCKGFNNKR